MCRSTSVGEHAARAAFQLTGQTFCEVHRLVVPAAGLSQLLVTRHSSLELDLVLMRSATAWGDSVLEAVW